MAFLAERVLGNVVSSGINVMVLEIDEWLRAWLAGFANAEADRQMGTPVSIPSTQAAVTGG